MFIQGCFYNILQADKGYSQSFSFKFNFICGWKRFCNTKNDYQMLREISDKLCLEYGLSVIKNLKKYTKKVNQYILKSFMNEIKRDIDATVLECARYMEFSAVMHNKGYSFGEINN